MDAGYKRAVKWITSREKYNFYVEDDDSEEYDFPDIDEPMLLSDIFAARASGDLDNFERALDNLNKFLKSKEVVSDQLIQSGIVDILIQHARFCQATEGKISRLSILALYHATLSEHLSPHLVAHGAIGVFIDLLKGPFVPLSICAVDGIRNLALDIPEIIDDLQRTVGIRLFLEAAEKSRICEKRHTLMLRLVAALLSHFSRTKLTKAEVVLLMEFYGTILNRNSPVTLQWGAALRGIYSLVVHDKLNNVDSSVFDYVPDMIEAAVAELPESRPNVAAACDVVRKMLKYDTNPNLSVRTVIEICDKCFDTEAGVAAYRLLHALAKRCDGDENWDICMNGLPTLVQGISRGGFEIRHAATETLVRVIDGTDHRLIKFFLTTEGCLLTIVGLLDLEEYSAKAIEQLNILFERCLIEGLAGDFVALLFKIGGCEALDHFLEEQQDENSLHFARRLLERMSLSTSSPP